MIRAIHTGATGMIAQQFLVDNVANNIANVNTTGFKRSVVNFQDLIYATLIQPGTQIVQGQEVPTGLQIGNGVRVAGTTHIFTPGTLESTGNSLDLAIEGPGFFQVLGIDNEPRYTRDGAFRLDANGNIVNTDGFRLEPNITIPDDAVSISVSRTGVVSYTTDSNPAPTEAGQIQLARFANEAGLSAEGRNLFRETAASGQPQTSNPGEQGVGEVLGSFLERSNVEVVTELVSLILAQRAFEFNTRSVQVSDQMLSTASELVR
jgi:flagellar basal-body rod protein FlgG